MEASLTQAVNIQETFNAYQYRIYKLDFCSYNFHIFRFSRSGEGEVDVYRFMSKHSSDHFGLFCGSVENAECGVRSAECGKCGVWKMRSVENAECGKCGVWKMRSVENEECGKCGVWKMWGVENAECGKCVENFNFPSHFVIPMWINNV